MTDPVRPEPLQQDEVVTPGGVRPQRSTEEHGKGHVEAPGAEPPHQRLAEAGPDYPVAHAEPRGADAHAPGGHHGDRGTVVTGDGGVDAASGHGDEHDTEHGDAHAEPRLGPVDRAAWGAGVAGIVIGVVIALLFWVATLPR